VVVSLRNRPRSSMIGAVRRNAAVLFAQLALHQGYRPSILIAVPGRIELQSSRRPRLSADLHQGRVAELLAPSPARGVPAPVGQFRRGAPDPGRVLAIQGARAVAVLFADPRGAARVTGLLLDASRAVVSTKYMTAGPVRGPDVARVKSRPGGIQE